MTLPPLSLDDLTFEDLRLLAVRRIPAASGERWTHHEPVDPGVTMIELFAFLLDQQVFMLDQVPDSMMLALLGLLGEAPTPSRCARTVLAPDPGGQAEFAILGANTPLKPTDPGLASLIFTPLSEVLIAPVQSASLELASSSLPLPLDRAAKLLDGAGNPAEFAISVVLAEPFSPAHVGKTVNVLIDLLDPGVPPEWSHDAVSAPSPAEWQFSLSFPGGTAPVDTWNDGTGGLRRSGLLGFAIPPELVGQSQFEIRATSPEANHALPVQCSAISCGAAAVEHRWKRTFGPAANGDAEHDAVLSDLLDQLTNLLPISGRTLSVPSSVGAIIANSIIFDARHQRDGWLTWEPRQDLALARPEDRYFIFDRTLSQLRFGDGHQGRIPAPADQLTLAVDVGGGADANHAPGLRWERQNAGLEVNLMTQVAADEGAEAETLEDARERVASELSRRERAVTAEDYATLAETTPGIAPHRAIVAVGHDPSFPCLYIDDSLTVFVIPRSDAEFTAPIADDGAIETIAARLEEARLLTTRVFVRRPNLRPVGVEITVRGDDGQSGSSFRAGFEERLREYLHPTLGGPANSGWEAGQSLRPSELLQVAQATLDGSARIEALAVSLLDQVGEPSDCLEVELEPYDLVYLARLTVQLEQAQTSEAVL